MKSQYFTAALFEQVNQPLVLRVLQVPQYLSVGQVLVKIFFSGVCGAQLGEIADIKGLNAKYAPNCMGHEGSAEVIAVGPGVRNVKIGDHAVVHWRKGVGIESLPPKYWCPELKRDIGGGWATTFQQYSVVSENRLTKIDKDIPMDIAALLGCAVTTGLGVISNELRVKMGQSVVVLGCGGVGLNVLQGAMLANAYPIIGVDIVQEKLHQAIIMGATATVNSSESNLLETVKKLTAGGADYVIDTTGNPQIMQMAWDMAASNGMVCFVAQLKHDQTIPLQTLAMHHGKRLTGSDGGQTNPTEDIPRYIKLLKAGRLNLRGLITHKIPLKEINDLFSEIRAGRVGRGIVDMQ